MTYEEAHDLDLLIAKSDPYILIDELPPLAPCRCGGAAHLDISMALIACETCGMSFEYRYNQGVIPYYSWQKAAGVDVAPYKAK